MNFEQFLNEAKNFKVGDTWEWHGKDWSADQKKDVDTIKKVKITKVEGSNITGQFDGESKEYIIRDANKYLKKKVNESEEITESNIKVGDTVSRKFMGEDPTQTFKVISISGGKAKLKDTKTGEENGMYLSDLIKESEELEEATKENPSVWVPGGFDKEMSKYPNNKITKEIVLKAAKKYNVDAEDAIQYVEFGWDIDLNESVNEAEASYGLSKAETKKVAETLAKAISKNDGVKCTVNLKSLEEDSFDLDIDGEEYEGGSYYINDKGEVVNAAITPHEIYGKAESSVEDFIKGLKKPVKESAEVNESKITIKRQYTENYPASTVGKHAGVRNKIIEALKDGQLTKEEFEQLVSGLTEDSKRWLKRNAAFFNIQEDQVSLSATGKKILKSIDESGYRPMTDAERQKAQYKKNQLARLRAVDKKEEEGKRLRALQQKLHQQKMRKANESFIYESFSEFVENELNEKAYRLTGHYTTKGIIGKVMQTFKKHIEHIKYEEDVEKTLKEVNKAWEHFHNEGSKIILDEVHKAVKDMEQVLYVQVDGLSQRWEADTINKLNKEGGPLYIVIPGDFVINIGFMDDVDGSKFKNKLGGMMNSAISGGEDLYGEFDPEIDENNVEIRGNEVIQIDSK
jgi:hypothetical protein